jgi:TolA-binding protein
MSDRRSFSEIPAELLRDHGATERVDRGWQRLAGELSSAPRRRTGFAPVVAVAAATFVLGVLVGARFLSREPAPLAAFGAEPPGPPKPAAQLATPTPTSSSESHGAPRSHQVRRTASHRVDVAPPSDIEPAPELAPVESSPASPASWQRLADEGQYAQALVTLEANGGFDAALRDATAEQLMSLVDVARATGQRQRAILALRRIVSEHGADPNASVAAWMLGNELAKAGDFSGAEQAFAMYRALSPNGDFAEDALARQVDMAAEQGNRDHARRLAEQYLKEFPDGPRTADIQSQLEQWAKAPNAGAQASPTERDPVSAPAADAGAAR